MLLLINLKISVDKNSFKTILCIKNNKNNKKQIK